MIRTSLFLPALAVPGAARHGVCRAGLAAGLPCFILVLVGPTTSVALTITLTMVTAIARGALVVIRTCKFRAAFIVPGAAWHVAHCTGLTAGLPFFILVLHRPATRMALAITLTVVTSIARGALEVI